MPGRACGWDLVGARGGTREVRTCAALPRVGDAPLLQSRGLPQQRRERLFVDLGSAVNLDVSHVTALAFEEPQAIRQRGSMEEAELYEAGIRVDVGNRSSLSDPAAITPLHGLGQARLDALHELPQRPDDGLILGSLV